MLVNFEHGFGDPDECASFHPSAMTHSFSEVADPASKIPGAVKHVASVKLKLKTSGMTYSTEAPSAKCKRQ